MKSKKLLCLLMVVFVFTSCARPANDYQRSTKPDESYEQCLDPLFDSSFPVGDDAFSFIATLNPTYSVLAPEKWQKTVDFSGSQGFSMMF